MKKFYDKYKNYLQAIFIVTILVLVFFEFGQISKEISISKLKEYMASYGLLQLILIAVLGIITVLPMIGYDIAFTKLMNIDMDRKKLSLLSYAVNAYNNLIGVAGIATFGLRYYMYGKKVEDKTLATKNIIGIMPFQPIGLSVYALIACLITLFTRQGSIDKYFVISLIFSFYFIAVYLITNIKSIKLLDKINKDAQITLTLSTLGEWTFLLAAFLLIGYIMGVNFNPFQVLLGLIIANVVGMVSQLPGGLGSFDIIMLNSLANSGVDAEQAAAWILIYRLACFILPFIVSTFIFINSLANDSERPYAKAGLDFVKSVLQRLAALMSIGYGLFLIFSVIIPQESSRVIELKHFISLAPLNMLNNFIGVGLGLLFILIGRMTYRKTEKSIYFMYGLLAITFVYLLLNKASIFSVIPLIIILILVFYTKSSLYRKQFIYSWEDMTKDSIITISIAAISFFIYGNRLHSFNLRDFKFPTEISIIYFLVFALIMILAFKLILSINKSNNDMFINKINTQEFIEFTKQNGSSLDAGLALLEDKYIYYYVDNKGHKTVAFQYTIINNKILVMSQSIGKEEDKKLAMDKFIHDADQYSYRPVFYEIDQDTTLDLHDYGYDFIKFGELAKVDLEEFSLEGSQHRNPRQVVTRFTKDGLSFEVLNPPYDQNLMNRLKEISDKWLGDRQEKGFSLGFFKESYLQESDIALVKSAQGEIIAFANIMPLEGQNEMTIDLMRYDQDIAPNGTMDYLFIQLFLYAKEKGKKYFSLGMAPLSMVGIMKTSYLTEKMIHLVYKYGNKFYSFAGLRKYKSKYAKIWEARYISYAPGNWLLYSFTALLKADD